MNFDFSEDEKIVRDQAARFLADKCDINVVRAAIDDGSGFNRSVWQGLAEMGLTGAAIPTAYGGVEAGYATLCLVAQELGASLAPVPFASSVYLASEAILQSGSESQKETLLPILASGEKIGTVAVIDNRRSQVRFSNGKLSGEKMIVPDGNVADFAVVLADNGQGSQGLYITDLGQSTVSRNPVQTVEPSRDAARLVFDGAIAEPLGQASEDGWQALGRVYDRAAVLIAFEQIGGAERALDMAVNYAKERFAFGRPIGSFQALKHMMADMYVALKLAESNCYYAAWALDTNSDELPLAAATARVSATQAFQLCSRDNIQVHGGMGFTWEFDCHLYYRRSNYLTQVLGGLAEWEEKLVTQLPASQSGV